MKLLIVDGHNYLFRAYYGVPPHEREGQSNHLVFTFLSLLRRMVREFEPTHLAVVFDSVTGADAKKEAREEYKATRPEHDRDVFDQKKVLDGALKAMNIFTLEHPDHEGDDLVGSIASQCADKGFQVYIASADGDFSQLVDERISLLREHRGEYDIITVARIQDKLGISPSQYVDYISLKGDSSDNIKGVKGVGPKAASQLISKWGSLEGILENIDFLPEKWARSFEGQAETLLELRNFLKIKRDLAILPESSKQFEYSSVSLMAPTRSILEQL